MTESQTISWIFMAIAMASEGEPTDYKGISDMADGINHAVPTHQEIQKSISRMLKDGLVEKKSNKYQLTEKGLIKYQRASNGVNTLLPIWHNLEVQFEQDK